ncbi:hypothetical protein GCM10027073_47970 [Streptomyces chlorus]
MWSHNMYDGSRTCKSFEMGDFETGAPARRPAVPDGEGGGGSGCGADSGFGAAAGA